MVLGFTEFCNMLYTLEYKAESWQRTQFYEELLKIIERKKDEVKQNGQTKQNG